MGSVFVYPGPFGLSAVVALSTNRAKANWELNPLIDRTEKTKVCFAGRLQGFQRNCGSAEAGQAEIIALAQICTLLLKAALFPKHSQTDSGSSVKLKSRTSNARACL